MLTPFFDSKRADKLNVQMIIYHEMDIFFQSDHLLKQGIYLYGIVMCKYR